MTDAYKHFQKKELILRDHLAIDRTVLANERTFLAYIRTAIASIAVGGTIIHFLTGDLAIIGGVVFVGVGLLFLIFGTHRFLAIKKDIDQLKK